MYRPSSALIPPASRLRQHPTQRSADHGSTVRSNPEPSNQIWRARQRRPWRIPLLRRRSTASVHGCVRRHKPKPRSTEPAPKIALLPRAASGPRPALVAMLTWVIVMIRGVHTLIRFRFSILIRVATTMDGDVAADARLCCRREFSRAVSIAVALASGSPGLANPTSTGIRTATWPIDVRRPLSETRAHDR
jgi:hypothetical protein